MGLTEEKDEIIDLDLAPAKRSKIRINGDQNNILELNLSDMNIISRLKKGYKELQKLSEEVANLSDDIADKNTDESLDILDTKLSELDTRMREQIDYIFDSNVSEHCLPLGGTMYDPHGGEFAYEHIIDSISKLYENNINKEFKAMQSRVKKHTDKYTKK